MGSLRLAIKRSLDEDEVKQNPSSNSPKKKRSTTVSTSPTTVASIPPKSKKKKGNKKRKKSLTTQLDNAAASSKEGDETAVVVVVQPPKIKIRLGINKKNKAPAKPNAAPRVGEVGYEFRKQFNNKRWYTAKVVEIRPLAGKLFFLIIAVKTLLF